MLGVVALGELEDRLPGLAARARRRRAPPARAVHSTASEQPGRGHPGELGRGRADRGRTWCSGAAGGTSRRPRGPPRPRPRGARCRALCSPVARISDLAGLEDRGDAHRDRLARHVLLAEEVGRGVLAGHQVEGDEPGAALEPRARLVEPDVPGRADAEELEVDAAGGADRLLVAPALAPRPRSRGTSPSGMWTFSAGMSSWEKRFSHMNRW